MEFLFWCAVWSVFAYYIAKYYEEKYPHLDIDPLMYGVGCLIFGFIWVMLYLAYKVRKHKKYGKYYRQ